MSIVELLDEEEYAPEVATLDERVRRYTGTDEMAPYVKATAHFLPALDHLGRQHLAVMPTAELPRRLKEMLAVGVSMVNGCTYCTVAHSELLRGMFDTTDAELVQLAATVSFVSGLNRFEAGTLAGDGPLFDPRTPEEVPLLGDIEAELGRLPAYYAVMAHDPDYLERVWAEELAVLHGGELDRLTVEYLAFATSVVNDAPHAVQLRRALLDELGAGATEVFEALEVVQLFQKNNVFTEGLQLHRVLEEGFWEG